MIRIVGPREVKSVGKDMPCIDTTSHSQWSRGLSPFFLGPCRLYGGHCARIMENAYQFTKCYPEHLGSDGMPTAAYWAWAQEGWRSARPQRYPRGKGVKPAYTFWDGRTLGYLEARRVVYLPLYRDAVARSPAFARLRRLYEVEGAIALFDFDGYDHDAAGMSLADVMVFDRRPMGHAFVLKMMLLHGEAVTPEAIMALPAAPAVHHALQRGLFA